MNGVCLTDLISHRPAVEVEVVVSIVASLLFKLDKIENLILFLIGLDRLISVV